MVLLLLTFCLLLLPLWEYVAVLCFVVRSSIAIILMGKRELVALLNLSSWCLVMVERLFLSVPWGCLRFVIVVFTDLTIYYMEIESYPHVTSLSLTFSLQINITQYLYPRYEVYRGYIVFAFSVVMYVCL